MNKLSYMTEALNLKIKENSRIILFIVFFLLVLGSYTTQSSVQSLFYIYIFAFPLFIGLHFYLEGGFTFIRSLLIFLAAHILIVISFYIENFTSYSLFYTRTPDYSFLSYLWELYSIESTGFIDLLNKRFNLT